MINRQSDAERQIEAVDYSPAEFAHVTGICRTLVFKAIKDRQIRSYKIGRRRIIPARAFCT